MIFLLDHNLNGHALIFFGSIPSQGKNPLSKVKRLLKLQFVVNLKID